MICDQGECICEDQCTPDARQCLDQDSYKVCKHDDESGCDYWYPYGCPQGETCSGGICN